MEDRETLLETAAALRGRGGRAVLATLVAVEGSSVRRPGARLLILPDGRLAGFLSAGCVEHDLAARVDRVLATRRAQTIRYDPATVADPVLGLGLGCGGGMTVLLEPWPPPAPPDPLSLATEVSRRRRPAASATVISPPEVAGSRAAVTPGGTVETSAPPGLREQLEELSREGLHGSSGLHRLGGAEVFVERIDPPLRIFIHGTTPPARALARLAEALGWETVPAARHGDVAPKLPLPRRGAPTPGHGVLPGGIEPDPWTVAALLAHDTAAEAKLLPVLLAGGVPYVGVMGSRGRKEQLLAELRRTSLPPGALERLHMPIGLDIGAESAAEIALAAAAEIVAVLRGRQGQPLSGTAGPIHDRARTG